jgi:hypothetical protein
LSYVFVAYTTQQFNHNNKADIVALHHIADAAARNAGAIAYWVGCACMPQTGPMQNTQEDVGEIMQHFDIANPKKVYRICDVIRGARSLVIAIGSPLDEGPGNGTTELMLEEWGRRIWTFPEVLLAPAGKDVKIFQRGNDLKQPLCISKNQFAARVWQEDAHVARQV